MVQETAVEGYEFDPKKELRRDYSLNYGSPTYNRYHGNHPTASNLKRISGYLTGTNDAHFKQKTAAGVESAELTKQHPPMLRENTHNITAMTSQSNDVNDVLINGTIERHTYHNDEEHQKRVDYITKRISGTSKEIKAHAIPLPRDLHTYSGIIGSWDLSHLKEGDALHTPAFTSSSITPRIAYSRSTVNHNATVRHPNGNTDFVKNILHFHLPKGYKGGAHIQSVSEYPDEHEYLLDKNQKWRVKAITHHTKEVSHGSEFVDAPTGSKNLVRTRDRHRVRFITLVPHEENQHITEATYHDEGISFRGFGNPAIKDIYADTPSNRRRVKFNNHVDKKTADGVQDGVEQGRRLEKTNSLKNTTDGAYEHVHSYSGSDSKYLNGRLAKNTKMSIFNKHDRPLMKLDKGLIQAFEKHARPLAEEVHAYSGLRGWSPKTKPGDILHLPAYTSTSVRANHTRVFALKEQHPTESQIMEQHILHFHLPKGYDKSLYIAPHSSHPVESELLLHKGQKWKHVETKTVNEIRNPGPKKRIHRTYVHTVVPYDGKTVSEQTEHTSVPFRHPPSLPSHIKHDAIHHVYNKFYDWGTQDASAQHERFLAHYGGQAEDTMIADNPISAYTTSAAAIKVNQTAIVKHLKKHDLPIPIHLTHRTEDTFAEDETFHHLDKALEEKSKPLPEDTHVYSGVGSWKLDDHKVGDVIHTPAYTSTTIHAPKARAFSYVSVLHFHLPKGSTHGAYIAGYSQHAGEKEFLLKRDQKWKITKVKTYPGRNHVISVVPHNETVSEVLIHEPNRIRDALTGHSLLHAVDSKLSSMFVTPHPDVAFDSPVGRALRTYTASSSSINNALIAGDTRYLAGHKKNNFSNIPTVYGHIKGVFAAAKPLPQDHHVYSGLGHWNPIQGTTGIGDTIHTPAFTSTSHNLEIARRFAPGGNILHFHLPKGYKKALNMRKFTGMKHESEVLLDHGQTWKIHNITHAKGVFGEAVRIISVKPHTIEPISEMATEHNPRMIQMILGANLPGKKNHVSDEEYEAYYNKSGPVEKHQRILTKYNSVNLSKSSHAKAVAQYTGEGSGDINKRLVKLASGKYTPHPEGHLPESKKKDKYGYPTENYKVVQAKRLVKHTNSLDDLFEQHKKPLTQDGHVYAGTGKWNPVKTLELGAVVHTPAFTSTSINPYHASDFTRRHIIHFQLPKGYDKGLYIGHKSAAGDEGEYLLRRNQKWKYVGTQKIKGSMNTWTRKRHPTISMHTFEPHEDTVNEALIHDPRQDLKRDALLGKRQHWADKHADLVNTRTKERGVRRQDEHDKLTRIHKFFDSNVLDYTDNSSHLTYHLLDPESTHHEDTEHLNEIIEKVTQGIKNNTHPLEQDHHVYSGIAYNIKPEIGDILHTPSFTSTSLDINIAKRFAQGASWGHDKTKHILHFHLPKGYEKGIYLGNHCSHHHEEHEMLLDKNQKWKVHDIKDYHQNISTSTLPSSPSKVKYNKYRVVTLKPHTES